MRSRQEIRQALEVMEIIFQGTTEAFPVLSVTWSLTKTKSNIKVFIFSNSMDMGEFSVSVLAVLEA